MDNNKPVKAGIEVNNPTSNELAPRRVKNTERKGEAAFASPTPIASIFTLVKFLFCTGESPGGFFKTLLILTLPLAGLEIIEDNYNVKHIEIAPKALLFPTSTVVRTLN